jgi:hypothetical protein
MQRSAQRIEASVPADVRTTPVQHTATPAGGVDEARRNADIARDSVRRVEESLKDDDRDRR